MAVEKKTTVDWQSNELDAIVADYFEMLSADISGRKYVKARHNAALMSRLDRTRGSIEFKYQNISAVLDELGLPWIPGFLPRRNYQSAIFDAIDRYLSGNPAVIEAASAPPAIIEAKPDAFVDPPKSRTEMPPIPERLRRLIRKFDPVERDHRNRSLGRAGEAFVVDIERARLEKQDRNDLARKVRWVSEEDGDGAGYDVLSFEPSGRESLIEVKTTNGTARTPFFLSRNEFETAKERPQEWRIYRVHLFSKNPSIFTIAPPLDAILHLRPESWRASF
jgi:hypothetical protein